jgi:DNA-binding transcriptional LysR family regulator
LLARARRISGEVGSFRAQARSLAAGVEAAVSITIDGMFPMPRFLDAIKRFQEIWPSVAPRVMAENLGAAAERVLDGRSIIAILSPVVIDTPVLVRRAAAEVYLVPVAAPNHPLAQAEGSITPEMVQDHIQLVLTDRSVMLAGRDFGVISTQTWRISDLGAKHAMLLAGLGWGGMPEHIVSDDLKAGRLVRIDPPGLEGGKVMTMYLTYRIDAAIGPAARWLTDYLTSQPPYETRNIFC